jgi:large subunit ribosomal protein L21
MADKFAIFSTGGKQYRVKLGDTIKVEKLNFDDEVEFDQVLMLGDAIGNPIISGAKVKAKVLEHKREEKVLVFKKKRRHNYRRTRGHRQQMTVLKITEIKG